MSRRVALVVLVPAIFSLVLLSGLSPRQQVSAQDAALLAQVFPYAAGSVVLTVRVVQANRPPILSVLIPLGAEIVSEGGHLEYGLSAEDPDGTAPALCAVGLPENASLADSGNGTGSLQFDPDFEQAGQYVVVVMASDGSLADSLEVLLSVTGTNRAPVLTAAAELMTREGEHLAFMANASDPDGTIPALSAGQFPKHAMLVDSGNGSALVTFDPDYDQAGEYIFTIIANDGQLCDSANVRIAVAEAALPRTFYLSQNYPNPFNSATLIVFNLGETAVGADAHVRLDIINILGQRVRTLVDQELGPGPHIYGWDGRDESSQPAASGMYFYQLRARGRIDMRKMVLLK